MDFLAEDETTGATQQLAVLIKEANVLHPWHSVRYTYMQVAC